MFTQRRGFSGSRELPPSHASSCANLSINLASKDLVHTYVPPSQRADTCPGKQNDTREKPEQDEITCSLSEFALVPPSQGADTCQSKQMIQEHITEQDEITCSLPERLATWLQCQPLCFLFCFQLDWLYELLFCFQSGFNCSQFLFALRLPFSEDLPLPPFPAGWTTS